MQAVRQKIKRALSMHDKESELYPLRRSSFGLARPLIPLAPANFDDHEDLDEETTGHLHKQLEEAEQEDTKYPQGRPGSFLNRLISHGNKKTEDQIAAEIAAGPKNAAELEDPPTTKHS
jgi:hypothetical protein